MGVVTLPNFLTGVRLVLVPVMLWLAFHGAATAVIAVMAICFVTDVLDGFAARLLHLRSELGAKLDSIADFAFYLSIPLAAWWAWPEVLLREAGYFAALIAGVLAPALVAVVKFRAVTSYHTWAVKLAALCTGISVLLLFAVDLIWPFRLSVLLSVLAALEEVAISLVLARPRSNVHSLWHALRER